MNKNTACFITASLLLFSAEIMAADVTITIPNVENNSGAIHSALWKGADGFLADDAEGVASQTQSAKAKSGAVIMIFKDVKPGTYAISLYHDENGNGEMDSNFLGIPKEAYGFSNDAKGSFGPPSFSAASFTVKNSDVPMSITLNY